MLLFVSTQILTNYHFNNFIFRQAQPAVKRTKLDVENVHMLVYCKDNLPKVQISTRTYEDEEEEEAEEELVLEKEATEILVEGIAKVKQIGSGKRLRLSEDGSQVRSKPPPLFVIDED